MNRVTPAMEQQYREDLRRYRGNVLARTLVLGIMEPVGWLFVALARLICGSGEEYG